MSMNMTAIVPIAIFIVFAAIIGIGISRANSQKASNGSIHRKNKTNPKNKKPYKAYDNNPVPEQLGIQLHIPLKAAIDRMEHVLTDDFTEKLKVRIMSKYPKMTAAEFQWKFLELKRYFLMAAVLKEVPMYSDAVDDIWHEMLMFTREYNRLGEALMGSPIHHAPHSSGGQPDPDGRAWFDWVYAHMFIHTAYSGRIWGTFFQHPLNREMIEELQTSKEEELISRGFNKRAVERYPEIRSTVSILISIAKEQANRAIPGATYSQDRPAFQSAAYMPYLAGALLFYSITQLGSFDSAMEQHYSEEELKQRAQNQSDSSSGGSSCSSNGSHHGDNNNNGCSVNSESSSDSGGGGTDSGGSGCSSGCGGGGD
jgi:hypothetical protein